MEQFFSSTNFNSYEYNNDIGCTDDCSDCSSESKYSSCLSDFDDLEIDPESDNDVSSILDDDYGDDDDLNENMEPRYPSSPISIAESIIAISHFYLRHNLSDSALSDLLELISLHCPEPNKCLSSLYFFRK